MDSNAKENWGLQSIHKHTQKEQKQQTDSNVINAHTSQKAKKRSPSTKETQSSTQTKPSYVQIAKHTFLVDQPETKLKLVHVTKKPTTKPIG